MNEARSEEIGYDAVRVASALYIWAFVAVVRVTS